MATVVGSTASTASTAACARIHLTHGAAALRASPACSRPRHTYELARRGPVMVVSKDNGTLRQRALSRLQVRVRPSRRLTPCSLPPLLRFL
jgi:hypothetical protein